MARRSTNRTKLHAKIAKPPSAWAADPKIPKRGRAVPPSSGRSRRPVRRRGVDGSLKKEQTNGITGARQGARRAGDQRM